MADTLPSTMLTVTINRPWKDVYQYASDPGNMHEWAAGLGSNFRFEHDEWVLHDPSGNEVKMRFTPNNPYGVLDHDVTANGQTTHNAMRVMPNGDGAEFSFLLLRAANVSEEAHAKDVEAVKKDLKSMRTIMERS